MTNPKRIDRKALSAKLFSLRLKRARRQLKQIKPTLAWTRAFNKWRRSLSNDNFLHSFAELCNDTEIPPAFAIWSGIAAISCALGRRVWIDMGTYTIYPNLYVLLVASSGRYRKSTSIDQAVRIIQELNPPPNLIAQKITPESFIQAMKTQEGVDITKLGAEACTAFGFADEMSTFLNQASYQAGLAPLLIQFFDCKKRFEYRTKGGGAEILTNVCFGLLSASTLDWIRSGIPKESIGAGLTSRVIFVFVDEPPRAVARTAFGDKKKSLLDTLIRLIQRIYSISGEVRVTEDAWALYERSYQGGTSERVRQVHSEVEEAIARRQVTPREADDIIRREFSGSWFYDLGRAFYEDPNLSGYASRRYLHAWKLAMILAACELSLDGTALVVHTKHLQGALLLLEQIEPYLKHVMDLISASEAGSILDKIKAMIKRRGRISHTDLMRAMSNTISSSDLKVLIDTLRESGQIGVDVVASQIFYKWSAA